MKIGHEGGVYNMASRNPGPFLWTITLPVHKVLETSIPPARVNQAPYCIHRTTIDDTWRGRWWCRRDQGTVVNWDNQDEGFWEAMHRRAVSSSWFMRAVCPLLWGWNPEDRLAVAPSRLQNSLQNTDENWGPRSDTTSMGRPCRRNTWSRTN